MAYPAVLLETLSDVVVRQTLYYTCLCEYHRFWDRLPCRAITTVIANE